MPTSATLPEQACELAERILQESQMHETRADRAHARQMAAMMEDRDGKAFTIALADEVMRIASPPRAAQRFRSILSKIGLPGYLGLLDQFLLRIAEQGSRVLPGLVMSQVAAQVRRESSSVILNGDPSALRHYIERRKAAGTRVNINLLGEAVLGESEAKRRLDEVIKLLSDPEIDYVSVKISAIFSQIHLVAYDATLEEIKRRLRTLYRAAQKHLTTSGKPKFVNLDMEEYRDLHLTVDAFCAVLDEPEFLSLEAGIVLQAYLPDSFEVLKDLTMWARQRVSSRNGAGIKVRLVKGANLAMESVEAMLHDWEQAPYGSKEEVDANFKRMLQFACTPENTAAVRIGVASHNLFDIAYALLLREQNGIQNRVEFEMLEGMANAQAQVVQQQANGLLTYAPIVREEHFQSAIAYLVRRLEENTTPGNFLRDLFSLKEGSDAWQHQRSRFLDACKLADSPKLTASPRRTQNRQTEQPITVSAEESFQNAADTDFSLQQNRRWIGAHLEQWASSASPAATLGDEATVEQALESAVRAQRGWADLGFDRRAAVLRSAATVIAKHRGETIACMQHDADKAVLEADAEVSEAVDFANYYAKALQQDEWSDGVKARALGVVLVTPPWNFPYAIPAGGCLAALVAGNSVILKPATETVKTAQLLAEHLWEAGVPRDVLQFVPVPDNEVGRKLVTDDRVAAVILTGGYETARMFQKWKPGLRLLAETSGKNSLIITQAADLDLAIKDLVKGAFGHAGQKCSATSLALIEAPVYDNPAFRRQLRDAAESLHVGRAETLSSVVTPLIREPGEALLRGLTTLEPGEEWLLQPQMIENNPRLWSPGIRMGVVAGSWFHRTECFGPVLGLIRVSDLSEAIAVQNANAFGLTGGIHSLDEEETRRWEQSVEVGNAYINRSTTGAIVQRQPFGGWKQSCIGSGAKAGGPNYVASLIRWEDLPFAPKYAKPLDPEIQKVVDRFSEHLPAHPVEKLQSSAESYYYWHRVHFSKEHDPTDLKCERNVFRYRPHGKIIARIEQTETALALAQIAVACDICGVALEISADSAISGFEVRIESVEDLAARLGTSGASVLRIDSRGPDRVLLEAAHASHVHVSDAPVLANGRIELLHYLREQSVSETRHRYGNIFES